MLQIKLNKKSDIPIKDNEDTSITEALETIYGNCGILIEINWNGYIIPILGSSVGHLYQNFVGIIKNIEAGKKLFEENFLDSNFTAKWLFSIDGEIAEIRSEWITVGNRRRIEKDIIENINEVSNKVALNKHEFQKSLKVLVQLINRDIFSAGYNNSLSGFFDV